MPRLLLVGPGSMGTALLEGCLDAGFCRPDECAIYHPKISEAKKRLFLDKGVRVNRCGHQADLTLLALKPDRLKELRYSTLAPYTGDDGIFISVAAGVSLGLLQQNGFAHCVRAMPNIACRHLAGITALYASDATGEKARTMAARFFASLGHCFWVKQETAIDPLMALTSCAPAFVLAVVDDLIAEAQTLGIAPEIAGQLGRKMLTGVVATLEADPASIQQHITAIASPGGATARGLSVYAQGGSPAIRAALRASARAFAPRGHKKE